MRKEKKQKKVYEEGKEKIKETVERVVDKQCMDKTCPFHGKLKTRGRVFEGKITKKLQRRVVVEFERMVYVPKYERYFKSKTKLHARTPFCMENEISVGDLVSIQECRPLSKIIHFVVIKKIKSVDEIK